MKKTINKLKAGIPAVLRVFGFRRLVIAMLVLCMPATVLAQGANQTTSAEQNFIFYLVIGLVFFVMLLVLVVAIYTLSILKTIIKNERGYAEEEVEGKESWFDRFKQKLTDAVPVEQEQTVLLSHEYDGIRELDNHLPPWWKWLFYVTIIFAVFYLAIYHVWESAPLQKEEYENELLAAAQRQQELKGDDEETINEDNVTLATESTVIEQGKSLYEVNCVACHRNDGGGLPGLGPNLTDEYWLHGGGIKNVYKTIQDGVPGTSMISWKTQMGPEDMRAVSSYVITLQGTDPPNAREPQGEKYVPETAASEETKVEIDSIATDEESVDAEEP